MNYAIRLIDNKTMVFDFQPKNVVLTLFLEGDFTAFQNDFLRLINDVLDGKSLVEEMTGNATHVIFNRDMTSIEDLYLDDEPANCIVPTIELRSLMEEWIQKRNEFFYSSNKEDV